MRQNCCAFELYIVVFSSRCIYSIYRVLKKTLKVKAILLKF